MFWLFHSFLCLYNGQTKFVDINHSEVSHCADGVCFHCLLRRSDRRVFMQCKFINGLTSIITLTAYDKIYFYVVTLQWSYCKYFQILQLWSPYLVHALSNMLNQKYIFSRVCKSTLNFPLHCNKQLLITRQKIPHKKTTNNERWLGTDPNYIFRIFGETLI